MAAATGAAQHARPAAGRPGRPVPVLFRLSYYTTKSQKMPSHF